MLDQGSIGATGAALSIFHQGKMIHARFDKIHRVIRDLKNAEKQCMDSLFMVCKMWSAYLYGMDNRPFNSGANFTKKRKDCWTYFLKLLISILQCSGSTCTTLPNMGTCHVTVLQRPKPYSTTYCKWSLSRTR
eukprot:2379338-Pyramimonas_sp.AAC.1